MNQNSHRGRVLDLTLKLQSVDDKRVMYLYSDISSPETLTSLLSHVWPGPGHSGKIHGENLAIERAIGKNGERTLWGGPCCENPPAVLIICMCVVTKT